MENQLQKILFGSFRKLQNTQAHLVAPPIFARLEIDTRPHPSYTHTAPKGSSYTLLVKDFQHIGECGIKENGLEHSLGHLCANTTAHTGAF